jgi:hypothetical protein
LFDRPASSKATERQLVFPVNRVAQSSVPTSAVGVNQTYSRAAKLQQVVSMAGGSNNSRQRRLLGAGPGLLLLLALLAACAQHVAARNFYDLLNVPQGASEQQIKRSYRKLALKYHPDKVCAHNSWQLTQHHSVCSGSSRKEQLGDSASKNNMSCNSFLRVAVQFTPRAGWLCRCLSLWH